MEKQSGGRKIFGAQLNEDDASRLVGGIIEKGFSDSSSRPGFSLAPPRPTVLPFPAARHRSHGPHWKPKIQGSIYNGDEAENEAEEEDEEDLTGLNKVGAFANPVLRKEKKGLDFSRWREIVDGGNNSRLHKKEESSKEQQNFMVQCENVGKLNSGSISQDATMHDKESQVPEVIKEQEQIVSDMTIDIEEGNVGMPSIGLKTLSEDVQVDNGKQYMQTDRISDGFLSQNVGNGPAVTLESQIDAENRARLAGMSADEIAEAQAEILSKLSPAGIEALKKRGLNKLKRKNHSNSGSLAIGEKDSFQNEKSLADSTVSSAPSNSNVASNANLKEKHGDLDGNIPNSFPKGTGLWDGWSKRVERVRELRFSMDGDIIENDTHLAATTGVISSSSDYTLDNVSERDFIRTEGDPGGAGYTIKEAVALTRSVISGQRALALHLIASVLNKAILGICQNQFASTLNYTGTNDSIDWEAIWAFALGPEPELALALRICLDDNHISVVVACAKVIQCVLTCEINESFFDIAERIPYYWMDIPTAPVFRSRPDIDGGFLHGGFWKCNTKPSNILPLAEDSLNNKPEDEHTIQDDVVVAGQDIAAGLIRMGVLQRFCYLLEVDPSAALEECTLSILIAIARHSPTCANAIMKCKSLVQIIVNRFTAIDPMKITPSKIKAVTLLKILARVSKKNCAEFVKNGIFEKMTLHLYLYSSSLDQWVKSGREACKLSSALLVEQLRFWEVCIHYGYSVSHFSNLFPALCIWLTFPAFEKLIEKNVVREYAMISKEAFLVLRALSKRLPNFYSNVHQMKATTEEDTENWSWSSVGPLIDSALEWTIINNIPHISRLVECENEHKEYSVSQESEINSLLWLISSAMHMFSGILEAVIPEDNRNLCNGRLPWLPEFVPKIGLAVIKNGFFSFSGVGGNKLDGNAGTGSLLESLCLLRLKCGVETSIASTCCLQGVIQVVVAVNKLISLANCKTQNGSSIYQTISREDKILSDGILQSCLPDLGDLITSLAELIDPKWQPMQSIETFGRGGPAPGIGVGWGASGGGFWSKITLSAEVDGILLVYLLDTLQIMSSENQFTLEQMSSVIQRINSALAVCLVLGPKGQSTIDKLFGILFQAPVLKSLDFIIRQSIDLNKWLKPFECEFKEEDYLLFSNVLISHFRNRWLGRKQKHISLDGDKAHNKSEKGRISLETIHEETAVSSLTNQDPTSLVVEWAYQRLPLPLHWFLSPLSTVHCSKNEFPSIASNTMTCNQEHMGFLDVLKGGLLFVFGIEAASTLLAADSPSPVLNVPVVWKLHALSVVLLTRMSVLEEGNCRIVYENLQNMYGQLLDVSTDVKSLNFQTEIHEGYSTFVETLVDQFAAVSYGDFLFGRQVACYLHRSVEAPVRLATWNALSTAFALELLPPLEKCISTADGYLEPVEDDERILEAYVKSWVSGALDKASTRFSASFTLALHHLSTFIFKACSSDMLPLRNKLVRSLLRDCSRKQQHEGMMISLIVYEKADARIRDGAGTEEEYMSQRNCETENRLQKLREGCEGNSSVLKVVEKLGSEISLKQHRGS